MTKPPQQFIVPAETPMSFCKSCHAEIYYVRQPSGKQMPVDCNVPEGRAPERGASSKDRLRFGLMDDEMMPLNGVGISHFITCPNAAAHRRPT